MQIAIADADGQFALREANHRFLNTLTTLGFLLRSDFGKFSDPAVHDTVCLFSNRIDAFAGLLRTLSVQQGDTLVDAPAHLARLCSQLCSIYLAPRGIYCDLIAEAGRLTQDGCRKLSLIVVELVTNAANHAFVGRAPGRITVSLRRIEAGWICQVADDGRGFRGDRSGEGMELVKDLVRSVGGELSMRSDAGGAVIALTVPDDFDVATVGPRLD